jgi:hypothetical protein
MAAGGRGAAAARGAAARREPVAQPIVPLRWCNELVFVLRRAGDAAR